MELPPEWSRRALLSTTALAGLGSLTGCLGSARDVPALADSGVTHAAETPGDTRCPADFLGGANGYDGVERCLSH